MKTIIRFCIDQIPSIETILKEAHIPYKTYDDSIQRDGRTSHYNWWIFTLEKNSPAYQAIQRELETQGGEVAGSQHTSLVFTKKEIESAEWLHVRTTCMKVDTDVDQLSFAACGNPIKGQCLVRHRISPIYCDRKIKWDSRHFFYSAYYYGYNELFCSEHAKELLQKGRFPLAYESLLRTKPPHEILPDVYHIVPCNILPAEAMITDEMSVQTDCPICGKKTYELMDDVQLVVDHRYLNADSLIYRTPNMFGPGWSTSACIISQAGHRFLVENGMDRGLRFVPIRVQ